MSESNSTVPGILEHFPFDKPRNLQVAVLKEAEKAFADGNKIVIIEAPVGSGKSPMAITVGSFFGDAHITTPRKSLQDQYFDDFGDKVVLMKGRNAYPCTRNKPAPDYNRVIKAIQLGRVRQPSRDETSCATAPCRDSKAIYNACAGQRDCPYNVAIDVASANKLVIHNMHSFIFQAHFGGKFEKRSLLVVDEAHEIENVIRGFITKKMSVRKALDSKEVPTMKTVDEWCDYFLKPEFVPELSAHEERAREHDPEFVTEADKYRENVLVFRERGEYYGENFTVKQEVNVVGGRPMSTTFEFIPHSLGNAAKTFLFDYGDKVLLLSGTIYDKNVFCRNIGINPEEAFFIRVPSAFPIKYRPIYAKKSLQVNTSFATWNENFGEMCEKINTIMAKFHDVKGLIHSPSYDASESIARELPHDRVIVHDKTNFQEKLEEFYASDKPLVFISPICQQGVDFKADRGRFQIITRIPYPNTSDPFVAHKVQNDFPWYNYQALVLFGQQIGRVNRSETDFGATFLLDSRFNKFIASNNSKIPKWLKDAIIY